MVERSRLADSSSRKGFNVNMRISNGGSRYGGGGGRPEKIKPFCLYKYFKRLLWISLGYLSFFFLISFIFNLIPSSTIDATLSKTTLSLSKSSRALFEQQLPKQPSSHPGVLKDLRVYVYDLPAKYNVDWLNNERCRNHLFAAEVAIHQALLTSEFRTLDPLEADFFFVPVYVSCNFSTINGFPAIGHARPLIKSAIQLISSELPFWNRTKGSDHVFVASHDYGACFHAMEDVAMADGIPEFLKNSVILQTFGVKYKHPCQDVENIVIPPYVSPEKVRSTLSKSPVNGRRDIFAFFRGKMEVHPKNISGRFYSKRVRTVILQKYGGDRRFYLKRHRFAGYQSEIVRSLFCLCPLGWAPWSPRLVESVALGCVPVIVADGIRLPFESAVPWADKSLTVAEKDVGKLGEILDYVAATNLSAIQGKLWEPDVRRALLFNDKVEEGDATWQVLCALSEKVGRSWRRSSWLAS